VSDTKPVALVTGGAGGIGQAINHRLVSDGWHVVAGDLGPALKDGDPGGDSITAAELDVTDRGSVERFVAGAAALGTIGGVVNCAGVVRFTPMSGFEDADASLVWEVNVAGSARVCSAAVARMDRGGTIVNISSVTGYIGRLRGASLYGASKAGLVAFTRYLATELAPQGIRVNGLAPGYIAVPMSPSMRAISGGEEQITKQVPLERLGTTDEMAEIVAFLLSARSSYINGETILADGGVRAA
jgi:NAD(P)-dependent dehydrogenase (short-subunit alcohol dehydrogenase family)